ncbi:MAG: Xaa-Pro peptidase family protein [Syntrophorhabdaceae bacterium]|nr:Xaa-Pro peptidase family protein [Syntrophorhabdaceae bacterium]
MLNGLSEGELTPREEVLRRIDALRKRMVEHGLNYGIIIQNVDMYYFAGTLQKGLLFIPIEGEPLLFIERTLERARYESPIDVIPIRKDRDVREIIDGKGILKGQGGMELDVVPVTLFERWKNILGLGMVKDISPLIRDVRMIKSPFEIKQIKKSGEIITRVFEKGREIIKEGMSEMEIGSLLELEGRKAGHQGFLRMRGLNQEMMSTYVTHGISGVIQSHGDVPISGVGVTHAIAQGPSLNRVRKGVPVLIDYGGGYNGYITDETRPYVIGEMKDIFKKAYDVAREIVDETLSVLKEGVNGTEIFDMALKKAKKARMEEYFMGYGPTKVSFIGHGLGLEINELPVITPRHNIPLKEGMVFAFEPKFVIPGEGAIGIEIDIIVRKEKAERVTDFPLDVVYI